MENIHWPGSRGQALMPAKYMTLGNLNLFGFLSPCDNSLHFNCSLGDRQSFYSLLTNSGEVAVDMPILQVQILRYRRMVNVRVDPCMK